MSGPIRRGTANPKLRRRTWLGAAIAVIVMLPVDSRAQNNPITGVIRGRVVDETTGTGIGTALIEFQDGRTRIRASAVADADGNFVLTNLPRGSFRLRVSRIGYARALTPYWRIESGETLTVSVYLDPDAVLLAPLEIRATERSRSPVLASFYQRLAIGLGGHAITREEIERRNPRLVTDLLVDVPGVRLESGGIGANNRIVSFARAIPRTGGRCPVQIWVDGMHVQGEVPLDELATPDLLEGIEIFRGISTIPAEFITPDARCGVIALWTKRGG